MVKHDRNITLDLLKFFGIILVLYGHCCQHLYYLPFEQNPFYRFVYSFHMPLFFVISGYFGLHYIYQPKSKVIYKKIKELLIPLFIWTIIAIICVETKKYFQHEKIYMLYDIIAITIKYFWFIKCLFLSYIVVIIMTKLFNNTLGILISLLISQFIIAFNFNIMFPAFILGMIVKRYEYAIKMNAFFIISIALFLSLVSHWNSSFWNIPNIYRIANQRELYIFAYKTIYKIAIGLSGSYMFLCIFVRFFCNFKKNIYKTLSIYGQYTLGIYLIQTIFIEELAPLLVQFHSYFYIFHLVIAPIISIFSTLIFGKIVYFAGKNNKISALLFGK